MAIEQGKGGGGGQSGCVCGAGLHRAQLYIIRTCEQARLATTTAAFRPLPRKLCVFWFFGFW